MNEFGFTDETNELILSILRRHEAIEKAVIFGSRAMNNFKAVSDVDLAIWQKEGSDVIARLKSDLEDSTLPYFFDVLDYRTDLTDNIKIEIDKYGKIFYLKGWKETRLGEVADVQNGYAFKSVEFSTLGVPIIKIKNIASGNITLDDLDYYSLNIENLKQFYIRKNDILVSMTGSHISQLSSAVGKVTKYNLNQLSLLNQRVGKIYPKEGLSDNSFLWFLLSQPDVQFFWGNKAGGSANQANISPDIIKSYRFLLPPLPEQRSIAAVLSSLDDKIELLREQNKTLEATAQAIFKEWFVKFNFPNATGIMIDSELGAIPEGWRVGKLGEMVEIFDSKRVPLASDVRAKRKGKFPYYGATSIMDYIDGYLFDGTYLLLAEDGSVMDDNGFPVMQYVWGQFWVSNHSHVLQGRNGFSTEVLYVILKKTNIIGIVNGAVQLKINQSNLLNFEILIPTIDILKIFDSMLQPMFNKLKNIDYQIQTLSSIRDAILPKLMKGEVRVQGVYDFV